MNTIYFGFNRKQKECRNKQIEISIVKCIQSNSFSYYEGNLVPDFYSTIVLEL